LYVPVLSVLIGSCTRETYQFLMLWLVVVQGVHISFDSLPSTRTMTISTALIPRHCWCQCLDKDAVLRSLDQSLLKSDPSRTQPFLCHGRLAVNNMLLNVSLINKWYVNIHIFVAILNVVLFGAKLYVWKYGQCIGGQAAKLNISARSWCIQDILAGFKLMILQLFCVRPTTGYLVFDNVLQYNVHNVM